MPSVVARRMAEQKEAAAARSKLTKTPSPPPPATLSPQKDTSTSKLPEVNVQSPSNSSAIPPDEPEDEDQTIVISKSKTNTATGLEKDKADEAQSDIQTPPKRKLQPRLPPEQFDKILVSVNRSPSLLVYTLLRLGIPNVIFIQIHLHRRKSFLHFLGT